MVDMDKWEPEQDKQRNSESRQWWQLTSWDYQYVGLPEVTGTGFFVVSWFLAISLGVTELPSLIDWVPKAETTLYFQDMDDLGDAKDIESLRKRKSQIKDE